MKKFNPLKKLLTGIVLFASFYLIFNNIGGADGIYNFQKFLQSQFAKYVNEHLAIIFGDIASLVLPIYMVYAFVSGLYRICTFNVYVPTFENNVKGGVIVKGHDSYPEINRVLSYRESKMSGMSSERAADLLISTASLDRLYTGYSKGEETQRTLSFMESKLCGMSSEKALDYLSDKL